MKYFLNFIFKAIALLVTFCLLVILAFITFLQTPYGQTLASSYARERLEKQFEGQIDIGEISIDFPLNIKLNSVRIKKNESTLIKISQLVFTVSLFDLLEKKIFIPSLYVKGVHLYPLQPATKLTQETSEISYSLESFPPAIVFGKFEIDQLHIDPYWFQYIHAADFIKESAGTNLHAEGSLEVHPYANWLFAFVKISGLSSDQPFNFAWEIESKKGHTKIDIQGHVPVNLFSQLANLPKDATFNMQMFADTTLPKWDRLLSDSLEVPIIYGEFLVYSTADIPNLWIQKEKPLNAEFILESTTKFAITKFSFQSPYGPIQGSILANIESKPKIEVELLSEFFNFQSYDFTNMRLISDLSWDNKSFFGNTQWEFNYKGSIFNNFTNWDTDLKNINLTNLNIQCNDLCLQGNLNIGMNDFTIDGTLTGSEISLSTLNNWVDYDLQGNGNIEIQFSLPFKAECIITSLALNTKHLNINNLSAKALWQTPLNYGPLVLDLIFYDLNASGFTADQTIVSMQIDSSQGSHPFYLQSQGNQSQGSPWELNTKGFWEIIPNGYQVVLESLQGQINHSDINMDQLPAFTITKDGLYASHFQLSFGASRLNGEINLSSAEVNSSLKGEQLPAEILQYLFQDMRLEGTWSFEGAIKGSLANPEGDVSLDLEKLRITEKAFANLPLLNGSAKMHLKDQTIVLAGTLHGLGSNPVKLEGKFPFLFSLHPFQAKIDETIPFNFHLEAEGEVEPFVHLFFTDTSSLSGYSQANFEISGLVNNPKINGEINLSHGQYESFNSGAIFRNITAHAKIDNALLTLTRLSAENGNKGAIESYGTMTLDSNLQYPFELNLNVVNNLLVNLDYATISASGKLLLSGNSMQGKLSGKLNIEKANVVVPDELPTQIKNLEVTYINQQNSNPKPVVKSSRESSWPLNLDLQLIIPNNLSIKAKSLTSEWNGDIALTGTTTEPLFNGEIKNIKGEYDFNGKIFRISQGSIHFAGEPSKKTSLYVVAEKDIDRIRAEIILRGSIKKPVVSFRSNPPLSQKEILSYILFNRGLTDINPMQGAQLNQSIVTLSSGKENTDFLSRLRSTIGIDRLDISSQGEGNDTNAISLQVGKYISHGIFVSVNKSINADSSNSIGIEASLTRFIKVKAEVSDESQDKLLLEWKKDY